MIVLRAMKMTVMPRSGLDVDARGFNDMIG